MGKSPQSKNRKPGKRRADQLVCDVKRAKRVNMIVSTPNQPGSSDDFVEERPRTRVKPAIEHKGEGEGKESAFVREFASKTRILANTGVEILQLVEKAPRVLFGDENFMKMQAAAQKFLGVSNEIVVDTNVVVDDAGVVGVQDDVVVAEQTDDGDDGVETDCVDGVDGVDGVESGRANKTKTGVTQGYHKLLCSIMYNNVQH
ncbi:P-loop containing nucleoside triphosphatehydrolases superfamily protein [Striga asiatica]|uniref:P-loop containing nucleoside triphosphatehydrolases superfamily protein n=1 Tax=Striga asiatica TaxID=4170 RepID=A0A5A7QQJ3_STRAF|nr:P-loop containing nucleoside triphosphatehydrolases superfamily protein [Striga asiatica]